MNIQEAEKILTLEGFSGLKQHLVASAELTDQDRQILAAAAVRDRDFRTAVQFLNDCQQQDAVNQLIRARIHFENGAFDSARAQLDLCSDRSDERWIWLNFCVELSRLKVESAGFVDDADQVFELLNASECEVSESWNGHEPLETMIELKRKLEGANQQPRLGGRALVEALFELVNSSESWLQEYQVLRFQLLATAGQRLVRLGYRRDALLRVREALNLDGSESGPDEWLAWGQFLRSIGEQDEVVLAVFRRAYAIWQSQHQSQQVNYCPAVALDLVSIYAEMGYLVEARALLFGFYDLGLRGTPLLKLLRKVLLREAYGQEELEQKTFVEAPESLPAELSPLLINRESLSLLFIKAERCFAAVGPKAGAPIMEAAKALKSALRARNWDEAREHESTLAHLVVRLHDQVSTQSGKA